MTVHIKQLTGKMHIGGWTSGRSLTACTKFYCNNVMLQLRLEIYFSHKTNQTCRKCHMHITFDCQQMLCSSLYLLPLQIWIIMIQMFKFMIQPNVQKFLVFALKANTSKPHAKVFFWYPGKTRANTTANQWFCNIFACI